MPQIVPKQVDVPEPLLALGREILVAALAPARVYAVGLEPGHYPRLLERLQGLSGLVAEHRDIVVVNWIPNCQDITSSGGSAHFSWSALNGNFAQGNPHQPWGIVKQALTDSLEQTRTNYNRGEIRLSGGYRCPHGNNNVGGAAQSKHMKRRRRHVLARSNVDRARVQFAGGSCRPHGPTESLNWSTYADRHYHAAW